MLCPQTQFAKEFFFRLCPRQFEGHQHGGAVQQTWEPPSCLWPRHSSQTHRHVTQICVYTHSEANMETSLTWCSHQGLGWGNGETKPCVTKSCHKISYEIFARQNHYFKAMKLRVRESVFAPKQNSVTETQLRGGPLNFRGQGKQTHHSPYIPTHTD